MPSLIGTAPNQVPVNAMLGSAAYQDVNNFAVETKASSDNSDFAASTKFVQGAITELVTTAGSGTAYTATVSNPPANYYNGYRVRVKLHASNGSSPTLNVNSLGAVAITYNAGTIPSLNDLQTSSVFELIYDSSIPAFKIMGLTLATQADAQAGTSTNKVITPQTLRSALNASGSAPIYACRAWVNFNGSGTGDLRRNSGNVSSITDNGTGNYTVNFTTVLPISEYTAVVTTGGNNLAFNNIIGGFPGTATPLGSNALQIVTTIGGGTTNTDAPWVTVAVFC